MDPLFVISLLEETTQTQAECEVGGLLKEKGIRKVEIYQVEINHTIMVWFNTEI